MNVADDILSKGFDTQLLVHGRTITHNGVSYKALIMNADAANVPVGLLDVMPDNGVMVWLKGDSSLLFKKGQAIECAELGMKYTIKAVSWKATSPCRWEILCDGVKTL